MDAQQWARVLGAGAEAARRATQELTIVISPAMLARGVLTAMQIECERIAGEGDD
jgi:hypothetical protein